MSALLSGDGVGLRTAQQEHRCKTGLPLGLLSVCIHSVLQESTDLCILAYCPISTQAVWFSSSCLCWLSYWTLRFHKPRATVANPVLSA